MKISKIANKVEPSLTRKLFNMAQNYNDVINLTLGDPDVIPDIKIREAACEAIKLGKTRYSANAGLIELRNEIAKHINKEYRISANPNNEIIVTAGGMEALYLSLLGLIDDGDEVIIQAPYYVNYVQMVKMCGGIPVILNADEKNNFCLTIEQIEKNITQRTVAIILNNPANPTGAVWNKVDIVKLADLVINKNLIIIADEVYNSLVYDNKQYESIINLKGMKERVILIDSISKRFAMTGYRIGYVYAPIDFIAALTKMQENIVACASLPSQYAAIAAYRYCDNDKKLKEIFEKRRDYIYKEINSIKKLSAVKPQSTFYLFVNIKETGLTSMEFATKLLEKKHVAVAPGITYGENYDDYIRIAFTLDIEKLKEAINKISEFILEL